MNSLLRGIAVGVVVWVCGCTSHSGSTSSESGTSSSSSSSTATIIVGTSPYWSSTPALKDLASFPIGMEVSAANDTRSIFVLKDQLPTINKHFNSLVAGVIMKMRYLHPAEKTYYYTDADALADYAAQHAMILHGHTLIWHWDSEIPAWMKNYTGDWESMLNDHVTQICTHFAGRVTSWDVVNEAIDETTTSGFRESMFYNHVGKKYIENAYIAARAADPNAVLYYNEFGMESSAQKLAILLAMLDDFKARSIPLDGVGFQMHTSLYSPKVDTIKAAFKAVADRGFKIRISEMDMQSNIGHASALDQSMANGQHDRYKEIIKAYLEAVPPAQRAGITFWGLVDGESWLNYLDPSYKDWPLLFNDDYSPKPAFYGVAEALAGY